MMEGTIDEKKNITHERTIFLKKLKQIKIYVYQFYFGIKLKNVFMIIIKLNL